jgi:hypothetical protein
MRFGVREVDGEFGGLVGVKPGLDPINKILRDEKFSKKNSENVKTALFVRKVRKII